MLAFLLQSAAAAQKQEEQKLDTFNVLGEACATGDLTAVKSLLLTLEDATAGLDTEYATFFTCLSFFTVTSYMFVLL